ncbi:peptidase S8/S53 domain-containing protein [Cyathus striatus]|nr:peptidase S8/S53 domain-containing protein [Cyathus striatus]
MKLFISYFLAIAISSAGAIPHVQRSPKVKETALTPRNWEKVGFATADHEIELRNGLPQPHFATLERHLYEVSDPFHERHGAYLSKEEAEALVAPRPESAELVDEWLSSHDLEPSALGRSPTKNWMILKVPVRLAETMLNTTYYVWKHLESGEHLVRTTSYSLPAHLHDHVDIWEDFEEEKTFTDSVAVAANKLSTTSVDSGYVPKAAKNSIGITGYLEQFANIQDLHSFYAEQLPEALNSTFKFISVNGGLNNQTLSEVGLEANLDVQFAYSLSYPTPGTFWSTPGRPPFNQDLTIQTNIRITCKDLIFMYFYAEPYADWLDYILSHSNVPLSISTSYGEAEQTVPESYAKRVCNGLALLGVRGVSLIFSSGDGNSDPATQSVLQMMVATLHDSSPCPPLLNDIYFMIKHIAYYLISVTAVGGTNNVPESAVYFSGEDSFERPLYQKLAIDPFVKKLPKDTYTGLWNKSNLSYLRINLCLLHLHRNGRGIPDVSAQGHAVSIGGTSASAPTFAAVALLNDARLAKGRPPLGFLNPLIYTLGVSGFNDITAGNNPGCGTPGFNYNMCLYADKVVQINNARKP